MVCAAYIVHVHMNAHASIILSWICAYIHMQGSAHWSVVVIHDHYSAIPDQYSALPDHHSLFVRPTVHRLHGSTAPDRAVGSGVDQNVCYIERLRMRH